MKLELRGLLIDAFPTLLEELERAFLPDIEFDYLDCVNTVHKAITYHMDMDFNICFFGDTFPQNEIAVFFQDYKKLNKQTPCVFVQLRDSLPFDFDRDSMKPFGFDTVVTLKGDHKDKTALWGALTLLIDKTDRDETIKDLDSIVDNLVAEVDRMARERKRGSKTPVSKVWANYLHEKARKFNDLAERFFEKLLKASESAEPFHTSKVDIPDEVLAKGLPHLYRERYKGQSHRVWERLLNKHGVSEGDKTPQKAPPQPEAVGTGEMPDSIQEGPTEPSDASPSEDLKADS